ncbi:hypothetical protein D3C75_945800 [compost metagenome]
MVRIPFKQLPNLPKRQTDSSGCIRIRQDDSAARSLIICGKYAELLVQRDGSKGKIEQISIHAIEAVGNVREQYRLIAVKKSLEGKGQDFIRSVADEYLTRGQSKPRCNSCSQPACVRVRI